MEDGKNITEMIVYDKENGEQNFSVDLSEWWIDGEDTDGDGLPFAGPTTVVSQDMYLALGSHVSCLKQLINPAADYEDIRLYENANGDYIGDINFEEDASIP